MNKLLVTILITTVICCKKDTKDDFNNLCSDFMIHYYTGSGWTGWRFEVDIFYPDTLTIFDQHIYPIFNERRAKYIIDKSEIDSIFLDLNKIKYIKLEEYGFGPNKPTDLPATFIKYRLCNCSDSGGYYVPDKNEVPVELYSLMGTVMGIVINHDSIIGKNFQ